LSKGEAVFIERGAATRHEKLPYQGYILHSARITIREEQSNDVAAIRRVILEAFEGPVEAELVDKLRANGKFELSLVAEVDGQVVGYILFTGVHIEKATPSPRTLGIAPLAVLKEFQRKGVGSALMRASLERCREMGHDAIVVVGHPEYYPKFGFLPASRYGLRCEYEVPEDVFMALELRAESLLGVRGLVRYQPEFGE
jgi:putative acetyltransferase